MLTPKQQNLVNNLKDMGYTLLDPDSYKTLESVITVVCPNGHKIKGTRQDLSESKYECIDCIKEHELNITDIKGYLLSLDAATYTTGFAIFNKAGQLLNTGIIEFNKKESYWNRIDKLLKEISKMCKKNNISVIAIENIQLQQNADVYKKLAMLRGVLLYELEFKQGYTVYSDIGAEEWRSFSNIKGLMRENKKEATRIKAKLIYGKDYKEDEADAIFLGRYVFFHMNAKIEKEKEEIQELISFGSDIN